MQKYQETEPKEKHYRPGEGSSGPGGIHRKSYQKYGNYGMVDTVDEEDDSEVNEVHKEGLDDTVHENLKINN